jgi:lipoate-protein ligase A
VLFEKIVIALDPEPHSAAFNMALDEIFLKQAQYPVLRIYRWSAPTVSFGYFGKISEAQAVANGRDIMRRWTGGGMVEHGTDITYTLVVPRDSAFLQHSAPESYRLIHEQIARWLNSRGVEAAVAPIAASETSGACFASHVQYDVLADGTKLAGAAQRRTRWGLLHQGSILAANGTNGRSASTLSVNDPAELAQWFATDLQPLPISTVWINSAHEVAEEKYATDAWLRKW